MNSNSQTGLCSYVFSDYFTNSKPNFKAITVTVIPTDEEPYSIVIDIKAETTLKCPFTDNKKYFDTIFKRYSPLEIPGYSVFRKPFEKSQHFKGRDLHVLLLKSDSYKFQRNPNAHAIELHCQTFLYGPLVVATTLSDPPYSLMPFYMEELSWLDESNALCGYTFPPPFNKAIPKANNRNSTDSALSKKIVDGRKTEKVNMFCESLEFFKKTMASDEFYMYKFKTIACPKINSKHDWRQCLYSHKQEDSRRPPDKIKYRCEMCSSLETYKTCRQEEHCGFSHSQMEVLYHPKKYKTELCNILKTTGKCGRMHCAFNHTRGEKKNSLQVPPLISEIVEKKRNSQPVYELSKIDDDYFSKMMAQIRQEDGSPSPKEKNVIENIKLMYKDIVD